MVVGSGSVAEPPLPPHSLKLPWLQQARSPVLEASHHLGPLSSLLTPVAALVMFIPNLRYVSVVVD
jgi:hypothetical protein